ncbi:uncharacterized protein TRIADDRAFT_29150, partial [Trichoplax adhaerens]
ESDSEDEDEQHRTETYSQYVPSKFKSGKRHPDPVVETSSLSSVLPPDITYNLNLPKSVIANGMLSSLQLEAVVYACQQHNTWLADGRRAGFLIGDGAGVGKGRTLAAIIYENYIEGRKRALWYYSVSNDLKYDSARDLKDIGAERIKIYSLNKFKYGKISSKENGCVRKGVIFATYSSLISESQGKAKYRTRLSQIIRWLGESFDGVIIFDECHKAKNLYRSASSKPTKTGKTVLALQNKLPKARIVYASATGASEPRNMAYMNRLGIWGKGTPFQEFENFIHAIDKGGVSAMELVAMDMKMSGVYMARQLSFTGVTFNIQEIPLSHDFKEMYNKSVKLWVEARQKFSQAATIMGADSKLHKNMWGQFWSAHQRFFKYLCIAAKVKVAVDIAKDAVANGKCVIIGLQSTGEAQMMEQLGESNGEIDDFISTAKGVFTALIEKHFPAPNMQRLAKLMGFDYSNNKGNNKSDSYDRKRKREENGSDSDTEKRACKDEENHSSNSDDSDSDNDSEIIKSDSNSESEEDINKLFNSSDSSDNGVSRKSKAKDASRDKKSKASKKVRQDAGLTLNDILRASGIDSSTRSWQKEDSSKADRARAVGNVRPPSHNASRSVSTPGESANQLKEQLLSSFEELAPKLPPNTLDELIDSLGGPKNVAEMTGRKGRVVCNADGTISYQSRCESDIPLEVLNLIEKKRFMDGEKLIAVISEAASSGISLHADKRVANRRRRVHITLELPWSADRAIQQFGRSHRSNQVSAPDYLYLISELAGEQRFASIIARRLESLGALTHGDRRATETRDFSKYNFDNRYGRTALEAVFNSVTGQQKAIVPAPENYEGDFFNDISEAMADVGLLNKQNRWPYYVYEKDYNSIPKFLNRILGIPVVLQNKLFAYFSDTLNKIIQESKKTGRWESGILDFGTDDMTVEKVQSIQFDVSSRHSGAMVKLHTLKLTRGLSWEKVVEIADGTSEEKDGFYLSVQTRNYKRVAVFIKQVITNSGAEDNFQIYRPNTGIQKKFERFTDILKKYRKSSKTAAKSVWIDQYEASLTLCSHAFWKGNCKKVAAGLACEVGLRCRTYHVFSGSVFSVWNCIESVLLGQSQQSKVQIVRLTTKEDEKIVGEYQT